MVVEKIENTNSPGTPDDWEHWMENWIWRAILCLVGSKDFNPSPTWIAARLDISIENAVQALESLERLGCIERDGRSYKTVHNWLQITPEKLERRRLLGAHRKYASQINSFLDVNDKFTSQTFLANSELIAKYSPHFMRLFKQMNEEGERLGLKEVYGSQMSFAQLTVKGDLK